MGLELSWMRADAPYMPIATMGLLSVLSDSDSTVQAVWADGARGPTLAISTEHDSDSAGEAIAGAAWPDLSALPWDGTLGQALKPILKASGQPVAELQRLLDAAAPTEHRLLTALVCDGALDDAGIPSRNRLLKGVKADLSGVAKAPKIKAGDLAAELRDGLRFRSGSSGFGLGFVPEIQTFGGTTGPAPSAKGSYSPLLNRLLWHGILALPPVTVARGRRRVIGGPLFANGSVLSWPRWRMPLGPRALRMLFGFAAIHADPCDARLLRARGIDAVYRSDAIPINNMIDAFRWGRQVM